MTKPELGHEGRNRHKANDGGVSLVDGCDAARFSLCHEHHRRTACGYEAQVRTIPDLDQRVLSFLRQQVECEKWRGQRYSEKARSIVGESLGEAAGLKAAGVSREEMFRRLFAVLDEVAPQD